MPFGLDFKASPIRPKFKRALNVICLMVHPQPDICNLPQYTSFKGKHALSTCTLTKTHGSNQAAGETASASAATVRDPRLHHSLPSRTRQVLPEGNICGLTSPTSCSILDIHDGSPVPQIPPRPNSPRKRDRVLKSYRHMRVSVSFIDPTVQADRYL